jgi:hypothetical protein
MKSIPLIVLTLATSSAVSAKDEAAGMVVALVSMSAEVQIGEPPVFVIAVRATTTPIRIFNFRDREYLRRHYVTITIKQDGDTVETPSAISDPGDPPSEADLTTLAPGGKFAFEYSGYPANLRHLPVGTYTACVAMWRDPEAEPVLSNLVTFRVRP